MKQERTYRKLWKNLEKKGISIDQFRKQIGESLADSLEHNKYVSTEKLSEISRSLGCADENDIMEEIVRNKYIIMTLSAASLLKNYKVEKDAKTGNAYIRYFIDDSDVRMKRMIIESTDMYYESALLYQIRSVMGKDDEETIKDKDFFSDKIFFVNFESLFNNLEEKDYKSDYSMRELHPYSNEIDNNYRLEQLFKNGIYVQNETGEEIHFIAFDKSSSMSRKGKISFIVDELVDKLREPLDQGIDFRNICKKSKEIQLYPSKYYAYRGLYLSDARRVEDERLQLNENSVIIIKDPKPFKPISQVILTAVENSDSKSKVAKLEMLEKEVIFDNYAVFDGEGLISPKYARIINDACGFEGATSFQIRLPFSKGMLHQVDFHAFIKEFLNTDSFMITDYLGNERDLMKADVIMPVSMFKCYSWLEEYAKNVGISDPVKFYFDQFKIHKHALYISNTDLIYGKSDYTKINYQILNTLSLNDKDFEKIIQRQINYSVHPLKYLEKDVTYLEIDDEKYDEDDAYNGELTDFNSAIRAYISDNKDMFYEPHINSSLKSLSDSLKNDLAKGRLLVEGEIRYLSRDLLYFLTSLLKIGGEKEKAKEIENHILKKEHFYMPQKNFDKYGAWYPVFRNPHLSRNEQCLLSAWFEADSNKGKNDFSDIYYRYFGHLRGILMVPQDSLVPQALGGADFDGDIVKIVFDDCIVNAVKNGTYKYNKTKKMYERALPIIEIPSLSGAQKECLPKNEYVSYKVIKNTFSNNIGKISNLSIRIGEKEYGNDKDYDREHTCAECTILTGLEIDAAKTGRRPYLKDIFKYGETLREAASFDYALEFKSIIEKLAKENIHVYKDLIDTKTLEDGNICFSLKRRKNDSEYLTEYVCKDNYRPIDKLPQFYFESVSEKIELEESPESENERRIFFKFQVDRNWRKSVDPVLKEKVGAIALAYHRINQVFSRINKWERNKGRYGGYIRTILRNQYDYSKYEEIVSNDIISLWNVIDNIAEPCEKKLEELKKNNWPFLLENQRDAVFNKVFSDYNYEADIVCPIIGNFDYSGYNLLIYALEDYEGMSEGKNWEEYLLSEYESFQNDAFKNKLKKIDIKTYEEVYSELRKIMVADESLKKSNKTVTLYSICKDRINKLISSGYNEKTDDFLERKAQLLFSISGSGYPDSNGDFFWKNLDYNEIKGLIYKDNSIL